MNIELIVQNSETGVIYDISNIAGTINLGTKLLDSQPGKLTFILKKDGVAKITEGSIVSLKVNTDEMFFGYVFTIKKSKAKTYNVTCYNQMYYLKNKDVYVFGPSTASDRFAKICQDKQLKYKVEIPSTYVLPASVEDDKTLFSMISDGIDKTLAYTGNWFTIYDNFGELTFTTINSLKTLLFIGDASLLNDYDFSRSIEQDTYNQVKLVKDNTETAKREVYIVKDSSTIARWGLLQYFEKVDESANSAQITQKAEALLKLKNRNTKSLSLSCVGSTSVFAGVGVVVGIQDLVEEGVPLNSYYIVSSCEHSFNNNAHTMKLELKVGV